MQYVIFNGSEQSLKKKKNSVLAQMNFITFDIWLSLLTIISVTASKFGKTPDEY